MRHSDSTPSPENPTLKALQALLRHDAPETTALEALLAQILAEESAGQALQLLNRQRPRSNSPKDPRWHEVRTRLGEILDRNRTLRLHTWQLDPNRKTVRLLLAIQPPTSEQNSSALIHTLAHLMTAGGFPLALGLEKKPRPMISLGPPLPLGMEGLREWADVVLQDSLKLPLEAWLQQLNGLAPAGLRFLEATQIPNHSSTLLELAREARWRWEPPSDFTELAQTKTQAFALATTFEIEKSGKVGGAKTLKRLDVRGLVTQLEWQGQVLYFSTRLQPGASLSPVKLLAGILEVEPARIINLTRLEVLLKDDPRLAQAQKYEPKLHNIYEDAVLLESCGNVERVEDDDDDDALLVMR